MKASHLEQSELESPHGESVVLSLGDSVGWELRVGKKIFVGQETVNTKKQLGWGRRPDIYRPL